MLARPTEDVVIKTLASGGVLEKEIDKIELLGSAQEIKWNRSEQGLTITLPPSLPETLVIGFAIHSKE